MIKYSKIGTQKIHEVLKCFCEDIPAVKTGAILDLNRRTVDRYYGIFRDRVVRYLISEEKLRFRWEVGGDKSYFWARRVCWKRWRWAAGKTPVFGLLKRDGKAYVKIADNCSKEQLMLIIQGKILEGSTIYLDGWKAYDGLVLNEYNHCRVFHSQNEFARGKNHVNGIEAFWSFVKRRPFKFNGIASSKLPIYLKECELRYNFRDRKDLFDIMNRIVKKF